MPTRNLEHPGPPAEVTSRSAARPRTVPVRTQDGRAVCERCAIADTAVTRMRGLLGRSELAAGDGLWIRPTNAIHMFFMRFAIDAVYLDRDGTVVKVVPRLRPWRMSFCRRARSVIELPAGEAERRSLQPGDRVEEVRADVSADAA